MAYAYCREQNERLKILRSMREIFIRIKKEIEYLKASVPEICHRLGTQNLIFGNVFRDIYEDLELQNGASFYDIWQRHFEERLKKTPLRETEKEMIELFPKSLIYRDSEGQAEGIDQYINEVSSYVDEVEAGIKSKNKVIMCMGIMAGMITVVILF